MIVPAGDQSLHEDWFAPERRFHLCVNYYGDDEAVAARYAARSDWFFRYKGTAFQSLIQILKHHDFWKRYAYVQRVDDDIRATAADWNTCFAICERFRLNSAQPSFEHDNLCWKIVGNDPQCLLRYTNFVEIQSPIWSRQTLQQHVLPLLLAHEGRIRTGWGLDYVFAHQLRFRDMAIIDRVKVAHTRPHSTSSGFYKELALDPRRELHETIARCGVRKRRAKVLGAVPLAREAEPPARAVLRRLKTAAVFRFGRR